MVMNMCVCVHVHRLYALGSLVHTFTKRTMARKQRDIGCGKASPPLCIPVRGGIGAHCVFVPWSLNRLHHPLSWVPGRSNSLPQPPAHLLDISSFVYMFIRPVLPNFGNTPLDVGTVFLQTQCWEGRPKSHSCDETF